MEINQAAKLLAQRIGETPPPRRAQAPAGALPVFAWCCAAPTESKPAADLASDRDHHKGEPTAKIRWTPACAVAVMRLGKIAAVSPVAGLVLRVSNTRTIG